MSSDAGVRAALYARVSTEEQAEEGVSLAAQLDYLRTYCDIHGLEIAGEFVDDGYTGRNAKRPAYQRMFEPDVRSTWDMLVVVKMDRIHRNSREFMAMMDDLKRHHQQFVSANDQIDTSTAVGRFVMDMVQRIAQLESEQTGERTYMGMHQKAEERSGILGFNAPYGYVFGDEGLEIQAEEAPVIEDIFNSYLSGMTMDDIAYRLNRAGTLTRRGNPWNKFNLRTILHNPIYAGYLHWEDIIWKGEFPSIIDVGTFDRTQEMMAAKIRNPEHRRCISLASLSQSGAAKA